jgi:hypothetical protein
MALLSSPKPKGDNNMVFKDYVAKMGPLKLFAGLEMTYSLKRTGERRTSTYLLYETSEGAPEELGTYVSLVVKRSVDKNTPVIWRSIKDRLLASWYRNHWDPLMSEGRPSNICPSIEIEGVRVIKAVPEDVEDIITMESICRAL